MAKTISIYWNSDSDDLLTLPDVPTVTCGNDGMQVLGPDWAIDELHRAVIEHPSQFTLASEPAMATDIDLAEAVAFSESGSPHFDSATEVESWLEAHA